MLLHDEEAISTIACLPQRRAWEEKRAALMLLAVSGWLCSPIRMQINDASRAFTGICNSVSGV